MEFKPKKYSCIKCEREQYTNERCFGCGRKVFAELKNKEELDYNEVFKFMVEFGVDFINRYGELIIDQPTNTYTNITECKDIEDVKTHVIFSLCRPIGKGLEDKVATRLLKRVNNYFNVNLTKKDMHLMYGELCYTSKLEEFKSFIKRGFPMEELEKENVG